MNFGGLGFSFFAEDKLTPVVDGIKTGIDGLWSGFKKLSFVSKKIGGGISSTLSNVGKGFSKVGKMGKGAISGISSSIMGIAGSVQSPELDSAFSSMYAQFGKTFGQITAGMNISEKEASKWRKSIGSSAHALNVDMGSTAESWAAFRRQGIKLNEVLGTKGTTQTIKRLIKITDVMGISGEQLSMVTASLVKGFNFTEKSAGSLMDKVFALGKHFGMGREAMQEYPAIMQSLSEELYDFYKGAKPEDVERLTISIMKLGGGFKEALGLKAPEAMEKARSVFTSLIQNRRDIKKMFIGMGGDFGDFVKEIGISSGDMSEMFDIMKSDPAEFMDKMHQLTKVVKSRVGEQGTQYQRLIQAVHGAMGADFVRAMQGNWVKGQEAMKGSTEVLKNSVGALGKASEKAFSSGRTRGESYSLMVDSMKSKLHGLVRTDLDKWMKGQRKGFNALSGNLDKIIKEGGPLATITRKLLMVQKVGISGLFTGLGGLGPVLADSLGKMTPMITALGSMGVNLGTIGKLLGPGGLVLGGFMLFNKEFRGKVIKYVKGFIDEIQDRFPKIFDEIKKSAIKVWVGFKDGMVSLFSWLQSNSRQIISSVVKYAGIVGSKLLDAISFILPKIVSATKKVFTEVFSVLSKVDWAKAYSKFVSVSTNVLTKALDLFGDFALKATSALSKVDWGRVANAWANGLVVMTGKASAVLSDFYKKIPGAIGKLVDALVPAIISFAKKIPGILWNALKTLVPMMWEGFKASLKIFKAIGEGLLKITWELGKAIFKSIKENLIKLGGIVWEWIKGLVGDMKDWVVGKVKGIWNGIKDSAQGAFSSISNYASSKWGKMKSDASAAWNFMSGESDKAAKKMTFDFGVVIDSVTKSALDSTNVFSFVFEQNAKSASSTASIWDTATSLISNYMGGLGDTAKGAARVISLANMDAASNLVKTWKNLAKKMAGKGLISDVMAKTYGDLATDVEKDIAGKQKTALGRGMSWLVAAGKTGSNVQSALDKAFSRFKAGVGGSLSEDQLSKMKARAGKEAMRLRMSGLPVEQAANLAIRNVQSDIMKGQISSAKSSFDASSLWSGSSKSKGISVTEKPSGSVGKKIDFTGTKKGDDVKALSQRIHELAVSVQAIANREQKVVLQLQPDMEAFFKVLRKKTRRENARTVGGGRN